MATIHLTRFTVNIIAYTAPICKFTSRHIVYKRGEKYRSDCVVNRVVPLFRKGNGDFPAID